MSEQADAHASEAPEYAAGGEPPAKRRRELRQTRRRLEILEAAAEEFAIRGYHDASLQRIGDKVGLSKASLYYYVSSKSDLLAELLIAAVDSQPAEVSEGEPAERLREFMHTHVSRVCTTVEGQALADNSDVLMSKTAPANLAAARRRYEDVLASILRSGIASGDFRDVPVRPVVKFIFAGLNSVPQWYQPSGEFPLERVVDDVMGILLTGVLADGRSSSIAPDSFDRTRTEK
ncbi:TetR/AcrR family transcriptional regulator [Nocardioides caldifontis]|uniref:TetR/AcrR family transcriptional regulator n=1 Tax=Nocardioides caldifontis TaxID=2588938 RepID=UPI0011DF671E|nr:TetR/AcrR family transcriptional regulator [Nocardioides caldifontis]